MNVPDLGALKGAKLPPGVAEQLAAGHQPVTQLPIHRLTTLIGNIEITDENQGHGQLLRIIRVHHGLPIGTEITQMKLPMEGAIHVARDLVKGTGYRVVHDPEADVADDMAAALGGNDQSPTIMTPEQAAAAGLDEGPTLDDVVTGEDPAMPVDDDA